MLKEPGAAPFQFPKNANCLRALFLLKNLLHQDDYYTYIHSVNVCKYAELLGKELGLPPEELDNLRMAALLHDIGKSQVMLEVLLKPGKLCSRELAMIKRHPEIGAEILLNYKLFSHLSIVTLCHHERYDGTGYPMGLQGEKIPFWARIIAVADSFDAMTTDRPYSRKRSLAEAVVELQKHSGTQFDPVLVEAMVKILERRKAAS